MRFFCRVISALECGRIAGVEAAKNGPITGGGGLNDVIVWFPNGSGEAVIDDVHLMYLCRNPLYKLLEFGMGGMNHHWFRLKLTMARFSKLFPNWLYHFDVMLGKYLQ